VERIDREGDSNRRAVEGGVRYLYRVPGKDLMVIAGQVSRSAFFGTVATHT
jgi:hypothetical protein